MAQKLWQYRSWGALAGEHKHKQRQTPSKEIVRESEESAGFGGTKPNEHLIGDFFAKATKAEGWGDEGAATEDARRTGEENKWTATKWILNDWLRNAKNKGASTGSATLVKRRIASLFGTLYYPCFYVFWSCDEKDEDRFSFSLNY